MQCLKDYDSQTQKLRTMELMERNDYNTEKLWVSLRIIGAEIEIVKDRMFTKNGVA